MTPKREQGLRWCFEVYNKGRHPDHLEIDDPSRQMFEAMIRDGQLERYRGQWRVTHIGLRLLGENGQ